MLFWMCSPFIIREPCDIILYLYISMSSCFSPGCGNLVNLFIRFIYNLFASKQLIKEFKNLDSLFDFLTSFKNTLDQT